MIYIIAALYVLGAYVTNCYLRIYPYSIVYKQYPNNWKITLGTILWFLVVPLMIICDSYEFFKR
jgi:branched-subunit amino acid transport protein AzlD